MHIAGVVASVTTSFVSAVSRLQLSFSVGDSDHPLRFEVQFNRVNIHEAAFYTMLTLSSS